MMITTHRLKWWSDEMGKNPYVEKFLTEVEVAAKQEIEKSIECLEHYGYTITAPIDER